MKKFISVLFISVFLILSGCSLLEETNNTLNYGTEATEYINELSTFVEDTSGLVNEAVNDTDAKAELESRLTELQATVENFNGIEVPAIAEGIHETIEEKNQQLLELTNNVIKNGEVVVEQLQGSELYQTIESITNLKNQIEQLGFE